MVIADPQSIVSNVCMCNRGIQIKPYVEPWPPEIIKFQLPISQKLVRVSKREQVLCFILPRYLYAHTNFCVHKVVFFLSYKKLLVYELSCEISSKYSTHMIW